MNFQSKHMRIAVSIGKEFLFIGWYECFLTVVLNFGNNNLQDVYHLYKNVELAFADIPPVEVREEITTTWPAIHTIEIDDENRLWVSTIIDSDSTFKWWVLDEEGELQARFTLPGARSSRNVMAKPVTLIKNGYFYTRERDLAAGIDLIVKYRIVFKER